MADLPPYAGLDPTVLNSLGAPTLGAPAPVQRVDMPEYGGAPIGIATLPPPPPPPPPPQQRIDFGGLDPSLAGVISSGGLGETRASTPNLAAPEPEPYAGLHPSVVSGVQNGFILGMPAESAEGQAPSAAPVQNTPDYKLGTVNALQTPQEIAASNKAYAKQQAKQAAFDASPEGIAEKADAERRAAIDQEQQANKDAAAAEEAGNTAKVTAIQASQARQAEQDKINAARMAAKQADVDKYTAQYAQQVKDAANFKVDTDRHISTGGLIAVALSGIGNALDHNHGPNAALQILENGIDKRIADQWAQKKALGETAEQTKGVLDMYRKNSDDERQAQQFQRAAEREKLADDLQLVAAQTANPMVKARAEAASAALREKGAAITAGEAQRKAQKIEQDRDFQIKQQQVGIAAGHLALARDQFKFQQDQAALQAAKDLLVQQGKVTQEVAERGVWMPTGKVDEKTGVAEQKPITQQNGDAYVAPAGKAGEKIGDIHTATLKAMRAVDNMRLKRAEFGGDQQLFNKFLGTEDGRLLQQQMAQGIMAIHQASGINRFSGEVVDLSKEMLTGGISPDSIRGVMKALDQARVDLKDNFNAELRGVGKYTGKDVEFHDPTKDLKPSQSAQDYQIKEALRSVSSKEGTSDNPLVREFGSGSQNELYGKLKDAGGVLPSTAKLLETIAANSRSSDSNVSGKALAQLKQFASDSEEPAVRSLANAYLTYVPVPEQQIGPATSVARDTLSYGAKK